jgi:hypothetical protein
MFFVSRGEAESRHCAMRPRMNGALRASKGGVKEGAGGDNLRIRPKGGKRLPFPVSADAELEVGLEEADRKSFCGSTPRSQQGWDPDHSKLLLRGWLTAEAILAGGGALRFDLFWRKSADAKLPGALPGALQPFGRRTGCGRADADRFVFCDCAAEQPLDGGLLVRREVSDFVNHAQIYNSGNKIGRTCVLIRPTSPSL